MEKEPLEALKVFSISPSDLHKFGAYNIKPEFVLMNSNFSYQMCRKFISQGIDSSACKPALIQDTEYMVEKTYHIAPYLGAFWAYLMTQ